jgi:Tol biopolymer transport system component
MLDAERWRQIDQIFHEALKRKPNERDVFLERECAGDASLRKEIETLIRSHDAAGSFLENAAALPSSGAFAGQTFGPYQIGTLLDAGGMGEVYKARDTRLNRTVAIKVLPSYFSNNSEIKSRFDREAQTIAGLNHPHICVLHDVGHQDGTDYLVMEYLEGQTLAKRLEKGALPLDESLKIAVQIADALAKAHHQGIIHRDLKPANIMLTKSGAKLLDFGLAKLRTSSVRSASSSPTAGANITEQGSILGTLQYMAPEQIEGEEADARSDIFALGAVLYEMVTGKKAFRGKSRASLIASILEHDPMPMPALQPLTPTVLDHAVQLCLAKEPENRWQTAHDLTLQLRWIADGAVKASVNAAAASKRKFRESLAWAICGGILAAALTAFLIFHFRTTPPEAKQVEFSITPPGGGEFGPTGFDTAPIPVISPDGQRVAFLATGPGESVWRIWVRPADSSEPRPLAGTENAIYPFWSTDSRKIGFFAGGKLNTIEYSGGPVQVLCDAPAARGGTWNSEGVILFAPSNGGGGLHEVSAVGGQSKAITNPVATREEAYHNWPAFLPDGKHFLYLAGLNTIYAGSLDSKETKRLLNAESRAVYAPPGYLLFIRQGALMGQSFDAVSMQLHGEPFRIAENVRYNPAIGRAAFSVSDSGVLVYRGGSKAELHAAWFDRNGKRLEPINQTGDSSSPRLSPDETRIAVERREAGHSAIWIIDLIRGTNTRLTFSSNNETNPIWSPDGSRIIYGVELNGKRAIYQKLATGSGNEELLFKSDLDTTPTDWSPDGQFISVYSGANPKTGNDLFVLPMTGERKLQPLVQTPFGDAAAQFSPDGKWVAYWNNESGTNQTYVQPFLQTGEKIQISVDGGAQPRWRGDGKELFFVSLDNRMMAVDIESGPKFHAGVPKALFQIPGYGGGGQGGGLGRYAVTRDGKRFLIPINTELTDSPVTVILNWTAKLKK